MIEPTTFNDHADPALSRSADRSMRFLESAVALAAFVSALALAFFPH